MTMDYNTLIWIYVIGVGIFMLDLGTDPASPVRRSRGHWFAKATLSTIIPCAWPVLIGVWVIRVLRNAAK